MQITPITHTGPSSIYSEDLFSKKELQPWKQGPVDRMVHSRMGKGHSIISESFSYDSMTLTYNNGDGDTVQLNIEHMEYQKAAMFGPEKNSGRMEELNGDIKDMLFKIHKKMLRMILEKMGLANEIEGEEVESVESDEIPGLPEYWNAENTSQRIVDFAVSLAGFYEGTGEEVYEKIKAAIEQGFSEAGAILGDVPDAVGKLTNDTHALVMEKLENWAVAQGMISAPVENMAA